MANNILTIDMITRKALQMLENELVLTRTVNRQYDDSFAKQGAKIGNTLRIRLPDRVTVSDGPALQVQEENEQSTTLSITNQSHVGLNFTSAEMALSLDDFAERILKPRVSQLAATVDANTANVYSQFYHSVGSPGTTPGSSLVLLQGQQKLNENAVMTDSRYAMINPAANVGLVEGLKGLFNPSGVISDQFRKGTVADNILGYDQINMSQSVATHTTGTRNVSGTVASAVSTQGATTVPLSGLGNGNTVKRGDVFTIAGVFMVNPQTRQSTGSLQQFTVTADVTADGSGNATVSVSPAIFTADHALATVNAFPAASAVTAFLGAAGTQYAQNLIYQKNAITLATADLVLPDGVDMASRQTYNGISLRIVRQYDINNDRMPCRMDVLYGYGALRKEAGVRLWG